MPRPSTDCDIKLTGELRALLFDAGLTSGPFYWNIHGQVVLVAIADGIELVVLAKTPAKAIAAAEAEMFGGL